MLYFGMLSTRKYSVYINIHIHAIRILTLILQTLWDKNLRNSKELLKLIKLKFLSYVLQTWINIDKIDTDVCEKSISFQSKTISRAK